MHRTFIAVPCCCSFEGMKKRISAPAVPYAASSHNARCKNGEAQAYPNLEFLCECLCLMKVCERKYAKQPAVPYCRPTLTKGGSYCGFRQRALALFGLKTSLLQLLASQERLCGVMQCIALISDAMQSNAKQCNAMQCNAMQCNAMYCCRTTIAPWQLIAP